MCVVEDGAAECRCEPGYHEDAGQCVLDETCTPTTCNEHGDCDDSSGAPVCTCDEGYSGPFCGMCDTCTPCEPNPCTEAGRTMCVVVDDAAVCECDAGSHDEGGECVPDEECMSTTCSGHGTCDDTGGAVDCTCDTGWTGPYCGECDGDGGWHDDGAGDCTMDPCLPDPCTLDHTECEVSGGDAVCVCEAGYHDDGGVCVVDEVCGAGSCSGHGTCDDTGGEIDCACDAGYTGATCADCDAAAGYHDDGAGGCTDDACLPNPCASPKGVCAATGGTPPFVCSCDPGYHDDGTGGCTMDPCLPDPCAAMGMACMDDGDGTYTCYTPDCDDGNPCTVDENVGGTCVYTDATDGAACSTTLCISGQTCAGGSCGGGAIVVCDDGKDCTDDSCDAVLGCQFAADDGIVPDDGVDCTIDTCSGGIASHTLNDAACDDGQFCTGVDTCTATGCIVSSVPVRPPAESPCRHYGACDEATDSFPLIVEPVGAACNDGIACTDGETCTAEGACLGALIPDCPLGAGECTATTAWPGDIEFSMAIVSGAITMNGAAPPATSESSSDIELYAIDKTTGTRQYIGGLIYSGSYPYTLIEPATYTTKLVPGIYDILYRRSYSGSGDFVYVTYDDDTVANGNHLLMTDVVIAPGAQTLDIDFSMTTLSGAITMNGGAPPATSESSSDVELYVINKTTGTRQYIGGLVYSGSYPYTLIEPATYTTKIVPGVYDVLYRRSYSGSGDFVYVTYDDDTLANGNHLLMTDVVIPTGAHTLDLDFSMTTLSGDITMNGGAPPATSESSSDVELYVIDKTTGTRQYIGGLIYSGSYPYTLVEPASYATKIVPGVYDILYRRSYSGSGDFTYVTYDDDTLANGNHLLNICLLVSP
jgi:hypothetical protein